MVDNVTVFTAQDVKSSIDLTSGNGFMIISTVATEKHPVLVFVPVIVKVCDTVSVKFGLMVLGSFTESGGDQ